MQIEAHHTEGEPRGEQRTDGSAQRWPLKAPSRTGSKPVIGIRNEFSSVMNSVFPDLPSRDL
jgi:hypothetical protein